MALDIFNILEDEEEQEVLTPGLDGFIEKYGQTSDQDQDQDSLTPGLNSFIEKYGITSADEEEEEAESYIALEDIPIEERTEYGFKQQNTIARNIFNYGKAYYQSVTEKDLTVDQALARIRNAKQREIALQHPEVARAVAREGEGAAIIGGRLAVDIIDPVTFLLPWTKVAKGGKLATSLFGGGVAAGDAALAEYVNYGEVTPTNLGIATAGGFLSAGLGSVIQEKISKRGQESIAKQASDPEAGRRVPIEAATPTQVSPLEELRARYPAKELTSEDLRYISNISSDLSDNRQVTMSMRNPGLSVRSEGLNSLKVRLDTVSGELRTAKAKKGKSKDSLLIDQLQKDYDRLTEEVGFAERKLMSSNIEMVMDSRDFEEAIIKEGIKRRDLPSGLIEKIIYEGTRPVIGGLGGYAASGLVGDEDDTAITISMVAAGAGLGQWQKILQRTSLSKVDLDSAEMALEAAAGRNLATQVKLMSAGTTTARMDALGGFAKVIGNMLLSRPGAATVSVEDAVNISKRRFNVGVRDILGDYIDDMDVRKTAGILINGFEDVSNIKAGYKGLGRNTVNPLTAEQAEAAIRLAPLLKRQSNTMLEEAQNVGLKVDSLEDYGMAQLWDDVQIKDNVDLFLKTAVDALNVQKQNKGIKITASVNNKSKEQAEFFLNRLRGIVELVDDRPVKLSKYRPLSDHFEKHRFLEDPEARKMMAEAGFIKMDSLEVLDTYAERSLKGIEFARTFGANGEFINYAFDQIEKTFGSGIKNQKFKEQYLNQVKDTINAYWGMYGNKTAYGSIGATSISALTTLANTTFLPRVVISSLGDIIQPFQNSGIYSATKATVSRLSKDPTFAKRTGVKYDDSWEKEYSALMAHGSDPLDSVQSSLNNINKRFFKFVGLEWLTKAAGNFAYDTGVYRAFDISRKAARGRSLQKEIKSLSLSTDDLTYLKSFKNVTEAFSDDRGRKILDLAGQRSMDRDRLIPTVGNRLLFTQSRNPYVRSLGQFLSWAQAKTTQTNSLISRIENNDAKLAVRMLGLTSVYVGVQSLREITKPSYDPTRADVYEPVSQQGFKEAMELSGNFLPWHINKLLRMTEYPQNRDFVSQISPAAGYAEGMWDSLGGITRNLEQGDVEGAAVQGLKVVPFGREVMGYSERLGIGSLEDRPNFEKGGEVTDVPNVPTEPDQRIDKMTGMPYDQQAGMAFVDEEDPVRRLGFVGGGLTQDPLRKLGFGG